MRFVTLTAVRTGEAIGATGEEFNLNEAIWTFQSGGQGRAANINRVIAERPIALQIFSKSRHPASLARLAKFLPSRPSWVRLTRLLAQLFSSAEKYCAFFFGSRVFGASQYFEESPLIVRHLATHVQIDPSTSYTL